MSDFNKKKVQFFRKIKTQKPYEIEKQVIDKRRKWLKNNNLENVHLSPREAFNTLFFDYMGLKEEDLDITFEDDNKIEWLSKNPCPTLEVCEENKLETKIICRNIYEKSTQAFLSGLDPQLRFMRSYNEIRPNALYCKEWIYKIDFEKNMKIAIEEAKKSLNEGNKGYGAVIIFDNELVSRTHDTVFTENDPSLHAETKAIRDAAKKLRDKNLCGSILFSTCEPCPMCSSLAVWSNITTIIFGVSIIDTFNIGKERILINTKEILEKSPANIELLGGVLKKECLDLYREVTSVKTT